MAKLRGYDSRGYLLTGTNTCSCQVGTQFHTTVGLVILRRAVTPAGAKLTVIVSRRRGRQLLLAVDPHLGMVEVFLLFLSTLDGGGRKMKARGHAGVSTHQADVLGRWELCGLSDTVQDLGLSLFEYC